MNFLKLGTSFRLDSTLMNKSIIVYFPFIYKRINYFTLNVQNRASEIRCARIMLHMAFTTPSKMITIHTSLKQQIELTNRFWRLLLLLIDYIVH